MKVETISGAAVAAFILFVSHLLDKFANGATSISDVTEASWWIMALGAVLAFAKDYQAISARRYVAKLRGKDYDPNQ